MLPAFSSVPSQAITLLFAGQDTTAGTLSWAIHLLSLPEHRHILLDVSNAPSMTHDVCLLASADLLGGWAIVACRVHAKVLACIAIQYTSFWTRSATARDVHKCLHVLYVYSVGPKSFSCWKGDNPTTYARLLIAFLVVHPYGYTVQLLMHSKQLGQLQLG